MVGYHGAGWDISPPGKPAETLIHVMGSESGSVIGSFKMRQRSWVSLRQNFRRAFRGRFYSAGAPIVAAMAAGNELRVRWWAANAKDWRAPIGMVVAGTLAPCVERLHQRADSSDLARHSSLWPKADTNRLPKPKLRTPQIGRQGIHYLLSSRNSIQWISNLLAQTSAH